MQAIAKGVLMESLLRKTMGKKGGLKFFFFSFVPRDFVRKKMEET